MLLPERTMYVPAPRPWLLRSRSNDDLEVFMPLMSFMPERVYTPASNSVEAFIPLIPVAETTLITPCANSEEVSHAKPSGRA